MRFKEDYQYTFKHARHEELRRSVESLRTDAPESYLPILKKTHTDVTKALERIEKGQTASAQVVAESTRRSSQEVVKELGSLANRIEGRMDTLTTSVDDAAFQITGSIERAARYLGAELSHISYMLGNLTKIGMEMLEVLKQSLDNESRQYFEQGMLAYGQHEYEIARDRLLLALEANKTNAIAYILLGIIAVEEDESEAAMRYFDLTRKFAADDRHRALGWYHLANCHRALGDLEEARTCMDMAVDVQKREAWLWYEHAKICALQVLEDDCRVSLERAFMLDWDLWAFSECESGFDPVISAVVAARRNTKAKTAARLDKDIAELETLGGQLMALTAVESIPDEFDRALRDHISARESDHLDEYLRVIRTTESVKLAALESVQQLVDERIKKNDVSVKAIADERVYADRRIDQERHQAINEHHTAIEEEDKRIDQTPGDGMFWAWGILFGILVIVLILVLARIWNSAEDGTGMKVFATILVALGTAAIGFVVFWLGGAIGMGLGYVVAFFQKRRSWRGQQDSRLKEKELAVETRKRNSAADFDRRIKEAESLGVKLQNDKAAVYRALKELET